jgi:hypothetical protein
MAMYRLLREAAFEPEAAAAMTAAYEATLRALNLSDQQDALAELVAKKIIEAAEGGERDPIRLRIKALYRLVTSSNRLPIGKPSPQGPGRG